MDPSGASAAPVLMALHRVGPYHAARLEAASVGWKHPLVVLETRPDSQEYPWLLHDEQRSYQVVRLVGALGPEQDPPLVCMRQQLQELVSQLSPAVIVTVGWADSAYLELLRIGQQQGVPMVVISDSRNVDMHRSPWKEWIKSQLLRGYDAAVVAGTQSRHYLMKLGFSSAAIFQPWDVVDNQHFAQLAASTPAQSIDHQPFLCVARLIPEKNHKLLFQAYRVYQQEEGARALVLVGDGPLKPEIQRFCSDLPDPGKVLMVSFEQLESLGARYANAYALILPSHKDTWGLVVNEAMAAGVPVIVSDACGCAADLIQDGVTGWKFQADQPAGLVACLHQADQQHLDARQRMIDAAREHLADFSLDTFAQGVHQACEHAIKSYAPSRRSRLLAALLTQGRST